jgi:protocatechuate 3,4-dioxygenase beta subunit
VAGVVVGSAVNPGDRIQQVRVRGGEQSVNNNFGELQYGSIAGKVFADSDEDCEFTTGDVLLENVIVNLFDATGRLVNTTRTNALGEYRFENLAPGEYSVQEIQPMLTVGDRMRPYLQGGQKAGTGGGDSSVQDITTAIFVGSGQHFTGYDFCEILPATLSGFVHVDSDLDCVFDPGEQPLVGVRLELFDANGDYLAQTTTDANGHYEFDYLAPGTYTVRQQAVAGYFHEGQVAGAAGGDDSVAHVISNIRLTAGKDHPDYNFCELLPGKLSGYVFRDGPAITTADGQPPANLETLRDGKLTSDDQPLAGVVLELRNALTGEAIDPADVLPGLYPPGQVRTVTDEHGYYEFIGLSQGAYAVIQVQPEGYFDSLDTPGSNGGLALNRSTNPEQAAFRPLLLAGLKLNFDVIAQIPVGFGGSSPDNNFSEVLVQSDPPDVPLFFERPLTILPTLQQPEFIAPPQIAFIPPPPLPLAKPEESPQGGDGDFAWHLSVVNAGSPRGNTKSFRIDQARTLRAAKMLELSQWKAEHLHTGHWLFPVTNSANSLHSLSDFGLDNAVPLTGDFNGDGSSELALFFEGEWFIDINGNGAWDDADLWAKLGTKGDLPVVGDWDGDGKDDIGIYGLQWARDPLAVQHEPGLPDVDNQSTAFSKKLPPKNLPPQPHVATNGARQLQVTAAGPRTGDLIDHVFFLGGGTDLPITGDFNGDGIDTIGVFSAGLWRIDINGDGKFNSHDRVVQFGEQGDIPVVGDFDGDGVDELGTFRNGKWIIDSNHNGEIDAADKVFTLGESGDQPVVGDFNGDGIDEPGIYRSDRVARTARLEHK